MTIGDLRQIGQIPDFNCMKPSRRSDPSVETRRTRSTRPPWSRRRSKIGSLAVTTAGRCRASQRIWRRKRTGGGGKRKTKKRTTSEIARNGDKVYGNVSRGIWGTSVRKRDAFEGEEGMCWRRIGRLVRRTFCSHGCYDGTRLVV